MDVEEEIDRDTLEDLPPLPEYSYSLWALFLPIFCVLLIAWNVAWKGARR